MPDPFLNPFLHAYCMPRCHLRDYRPPGPGLYALCADKRIYIGETGNLADRLLGSLRERKFGETIVCFSLRSPEFLSMRARRAGLEADCISALHTLLWGHRTPLSLANGQYVEILDATAWRAKCAPDLLFALAFARTILFALGMPPAWYGLPYYAMLYADTAHSVRAQDLHCWPSIRDVARRARERRFKRGAKSSGVPLYSLNTVFCQLWREDAKARLACMTGKRPSGHFGAGLIP